MVVLKSRILRRPLSRRTLDRVVIRFTDSTVVGGPFGGLRYIEKASGSVLSAKLLGTYERELHGVIERSLERQPEWIIDIGCAEGYYAAGMAWRLRGNPAARVVAYDTDERAIEQAIGLAELNGVGGKIEFRADFTAAELARLDGRTGLLICDIEGGELQLFNSQSGRLLRHFDILVEVHDGEGVGTIKTALHRVFAATHDLTLLRYKGRKASDCDVMRWAGDEVLLQALDERRQRGIEWLMMYAKNRQK
jgi:SAM-dependent methyltransferase